MILNYLCFSDDPYNISSVGGVPVAEVLLGA